MKLKKWQQALVAVVLIGIASILAHMHVVAQSYRPTVQFASPEGLVFVAIQDSTSERRECGAANERFLAPIKQGCKECKIVVARCEREADDPFASAPVPALVPAHQIVAPGVRVSIDGPDALARAACDLLALDMAERGLRNAGCRHSR
jgi:hypothetical protein